MKLVYKRLSQSVILALGASFIVACGGGGSSTDTNTTADTTITHNGVEYKTVTSPTTSRVWLDRNLGAARVCESKTDTACYGDYYQWGRPADGHQDSNSALSSTKINDATNTGSNAFVKGFADWLNNGVDNNGAIRSANWLKTDGTSICPVGFRVPTKDELNAEFSSIHNADEAFNSFLKLPLSGFRNYNTGTLYQSSNYGYLWSSTPQGIYDGYSVYYNNSMLALSHTRRAHGFPVRCIKN